MKRFVLSLIMMSMFESIVFAQTSISIIPKPVKLQRLQGYFKIHPETVIAADENVRELAIELGQLIEPALGHTLMVKEGNHTGSNYIQLKLQSNLTSLGTEGYQLTATPQRILIEAPKKAGLFYGIQTFRQLLPPAIFSRKKGMGIQWQIPCVEITDYPRFRWRGMHLDVARHFMPKEFVKKYIDLLALHKMNTFHWHLTEDQGWRIEIKQYPRLTEVGAWRNETVIGRNSGTYDGKRYGGFYTQDDIREIVAYAKKRYITIVPEIEMPGHCLAALAAYPELSCTGGPFEVRTEWGVEPDVYCAGNDKVIEFQKNVLREVLELFPSKFIHIGGDECPKERWENCPKCQKRIRDEGLKDEHELQSWFIKQIDTFLAEKGRRLVGWDEILEGGLAPGGTVMSWRGEAGGIKAAQSGHDVVMAPNGYTYFDHYQANPNTEPLAIGGFLPIDKVYSYDPIPSALNDVQKKHILGVQAQIWTEYIPTAGDVEYMAYPRACALAEVAWTPKDRMGYDGFYNRLKTHLKRLASLDVNYRKLDPPMPVLGIWKSGQTNETFAPMIWDITSLLKEAGVYKVEFQYSEGAHRLDIQSVELLAGDTVIAKDEHLGTTGGMTKNNTYLLTIEKVEESVPYMLRAVVRSDGGTDSNGKIYLMKNQ